MAWSEPSNDGERNVTGGSLYQFVTQNASASKVHCERFFSELMRKSLIQKQVEKALKDSEPLSLVSEVNAISAEYNAKAVGPAASEVLERGMSELNQLSDILKKIPGKPQNLKVNKEGRDQVKLSWDPPAHNPEAVEEYVVYRKAAGGEWEEVVRTETTRALVKELKSQTKYGSRVFYKRYPRESVSLESEMYYEFQVVANSSILTGLAADTYYSTPRSTAATSVYKIIVGALVNASRILPYVLRKAILLKPSR